MTSSHTVAQAILELIVSGLEHVAVLLLQPTKCWDKRHVPPPNFLFYKNASLKELSLNFYLTNGTQNKVLSELPTNLLTACGSQQ